MKSVQENCGVFGIYSDCQCVSDIYQGIDLLQHRGQEFCGISTYDDGIKHTTHHGKVINTFIDQELSGLTGQWGIGHVSLKERQPIRWMSSQGEIALAFSGNIMNSDEIIRDMMARGKAFQKTYDIEIISKIVMEAGDIAQGLTNLADMVKGAYSLVVLTKDGVYAHRDVYGFRPLILGHGDGKFVVASESRALENLGLTTLRDVKPGEIVKIDSQGFTTLKQIESPERLIARLNGRTRPASIL